MSIRSIIQLVNSGETGAEIGALIGAKRANLETGGTARRDFMTLQGNKTEELKALGLISCPSENDSYCIGQNINHTQACIYLTQQDESIYKDLVVNLLKKSNIPYVVIKVSEDYAIDHATTFLKTHLTTNLYVTGDNSVISPDIAVKAACFVHKLFA
jgi:hypothetical protein